MIRRGKSRLPVAETKQLPEPAERGDCHSEVSLTDRWLESRAHRGGESAPTAQPAGDAALALDPAQDPFGIEVAEKNAYLSSKRVLDIAGALVGLAAIAPIWALIWVLQQIFDRGPFLYVHQRVGKHGREFTCYKIRSMKVGADKMKNKLLEQSHHGDSRTFKMARDPRVTRLGVFLRRSSLDETPQLINVLLGQLSLVGPRPSLPREVEQYTLDEMDRLDVKPGLTCIWQVSGRGEIPFEEQLEMDRHYIRNRSLGLDLRLILATFWAVVTARGAY